jgi:SAM-dependent methyltransferase
VALAAVVAAIGAMRPGPDAVLLSGDIADNASDDECARVRELLALLSVPTYVLPGNDDRPDALRRHYRLPGTGEEPIQYAAELGTWRLVVLDSTCPGADRGELDDARLDWLEAELLSDGTISPLAVTRWVGPADETDERLLSAIDGPVLDVGCGPGRHLHALARRGVFALGVDLSPTAVELARDRGGTAIVGSIFDRVPGAGMWRTALLLDGNIGIGGAPERLLARIGSLLGPTGEVIVELDPPGTATGSFLARIETRVEASAWFRWARVAFGDIEAVAGAAGYAVFDCAHKGPRWFARLGRGTVGNSR